MIIDTSALIAILRAEPESLAFAQAIEAAASRRMSAVNPTRTSLAGKLTVPWARLIVTMPSSSG